MRFFALAITAKRTIVKRRLRINAGHGGKKMPNIRKNIERDTMVLSINSAAENSIASPNTAAINHPISFGALIAYLKNSYTTITRRTLWAFQSQRHSKG